MDAHKVSGIRTDRIKCPMLCHLFEMIFEMFLVKLKLYVQIRIVDDHVQFGPQEKKKADQLSYHGRLSHRPHILRK